MYKIDFEHAGLEFVSGDTFGDVFDKPYVTHFAWRANTGEKPSFDGLVDIELSNGEVVERVNTRRTTEFDWKIDDINPTFKKWRPHLPKVEDNSYIPEPTPEDIEFDLLEKRLNEAKPKSPYDVDAHVSGKARCVQVDIKPIFTKAMADAGELPPVGSEYQTSGGLFTAMIHGTENGKATLCGKSLGGYIAIHWAKICKPIQTEREKAISKAAKVLEDFIGLQELEDGGYEKLAGELFSADLLKC
ncbi:hypothetical protein NVP1076O_07 [Vibrio phage 1.076.O._10N.286.51.B7]|nr:hypothetical protein NVP1076O_07 [Vibrio phage 1.076.O._10N.286.51.B7]